MGSKYTFTMPNSRVNIHVSFVVSAQADANPFTDVEHQQTTTTKRWLVGKVG